MATALEANPDFTEAQLYAMMRANVAHNSLIYGSCIAFVPYGHLPDRQLLAPYVFRRQGVISDLDIATIYNYTDPEWEWFDLPRRTQRDGWTEPYFDEGAGNVIHVLGAVFPRRPVPRRRHGRRRAGQTARPHDRQARVQRAVHDLQPPRNGHLR
jgi:hypothetical protein